MMPWGWMALFAVGGSFSAFAQVELGQCDAAPAPNAEVLKAEQALDRADANMARVYLNAVQRKSPDQADSLSVFVRRAQPAFGASGIGRFPVLPGLPDLPGLPSRSALQARGTCGQGRVGKRMRQP